MVKYILEENIFINSQYLMKIKNNKANLLSNNITI